MRYVFKKIKVNSSFYKRIFFYNLDLDQDFNSIILNSNEKRSIYPMTNKKACYCQAIKLLYRATRDGYTRIAFNSKFDGKANTITIIQNNLNYVFGGYASEAWNSYKEWIEDRNAFIFSLRRNGISINEKFQITKPQQAFCIDQSFALFSFGGCDIHVVTNSNAVTSSLTDFGNAYKLPEETFDF